MVNLGRAVPARPTERKWAIAESHRPKKERERKFVDECARGDLNPCDPN